jgi:hypothetical protein
MTSEVLHPLPRSRAVVAEQFRAVGIALRYEWILFFLGLAFLSLLFTLNEIREGRNPDVRSAFSLTAGISVPIALLGLFAPMSVWKSEGPDRRGYHWAMPVRRTQHTIAKSFAGWGWLMLLVAIVLLWGAITARATGGGIGVWSQRVASPGQGGAIQAYRIIQHEMATWQWLVPFTAVTISYLVGSIIVLASDHPWIWLAGITVGLFILGSTLSAAGLEDALEYFHTLIIGHYGLWGAISGTKQIVSELTLNDRTFTSSHGVPDLSSWLASTAIWMTAAAAGFLWAANRHPED